MDWLYWLTPWEESELVVIATAAAAILFLRGSLGNDPEFHRKAYFWAGLLSVYLVSHTQFDYYSEHQFFIHRLQHLVLHHLGPFLIVLSRPSAILFAGLPANMRRNLRAMLGSTPIKWLLRLLCHPMVAVMLFCGLIGFWLLPSIHFTAMIDWRLYRLMNWSMFINGLLFWGLVLHAGAFSMHLSPGARIAMMLAVIPPQIVIGALIFFTPVELYPVYTICGRAIGGLSAVLDQQIGGIILWIHGAMMSAVGVLMVARKELLPQKAMPLPRARL